jgi:hypothetical protein
MDNANVTQPSLRVDHLDLGADERLELAASMVRAGLALMTGLAQIRDRQGRHVEAIGDRGRAAPRRHHLAVRRRG